MIPAKLNLFIVDDDKSVVTLLKNFLTNRFGPSLNISTYYSGESVLKNVDDKTNIVILDYYLNGKSGLEVLKDIKKINPKTEVIMFSGNEDAATAIESFRKGATDYVIKDTSALNRISLLINGIISEPLRKVKEFGVTKFVLIFLFTFVSLGILVYLILKAVYNY